jgi:hypothetical protein
MLSVHEATECDPCECDEPDTNGRRKKVKDDLPAGRREPNLGSPRIYRAYDFRNVPSGSPHFRLAPHWRFTAGPPVEMLNL